MSITVSGDDVKQTIMLETRHHWLPVLLAVYLPVTFVITYTMAVAYEHVKPGFPYISDTGTFPPESCVFGQLLNIGAVIFGIIVYIRYRQIMLLFINVPGKQGLLRLNTAGFIIGMIVALGVSIVGNFQETNVIVVHLLGAMLAFGVGWVYMIVQTVLSYKMSHGPNNMPGNTQNMRRFKVALCVTDFILVLVLFGAAARAMSYNNDVKSYNWTASYPGYAEHLVSTISEWIIAVISVVYFSTFYTEFKHFRVTAPSVVFYNPEAIREEQAITVSTISVK